MRAVIVITLLSGTVLTGGCFSEPEKAVPECYFDGESQSLRTKYASEFCCTPGEGEDGNARCKALFAAELPAASELALCVPDNRGGGVCDVDCGENDERCRCFSSRDCGSDVCLSGSGSTCETEGFPTAGEGARCTFCGTP